uniref:Uncharacterized protein n=1 Tax=Rhizophora mucronata TaxID=61149 RepID=A0A2P2NC83_RHIMU
MYSCIDKLIENRIWELANLIETNAMVLLACFLSTLLLWCFS